MASCLIAAAIIWAASYWHLAHEYGLRPYMIKIDEPIIIVAGSMLAIFIATVPFVLVATAISYFYYLRHAGWYIVGGAAIGGICCRLYDALSSWIGPYNQLSTDLVCVVAGALAGANFWVLAIRTSMRPLASVSQVGDKE